MTHKKLKEYMLARYKRQVELYKEACKNHRTISRQVFFSRIELLESMFGDMFGWHLTAEEDEKRTTVIYNCFGHVGMSPKVIYNWSL